jgi:hypothetical protein
VHPLSETIFVRLDETTVHRLKRLAWREGSTLASLVSEILKLHADAWDVRKYEQTQDAKQHHPLT